MNIRQHSALARRLITACGGLEEAAAHCRVGRSNLSNYQNPDQSASMPADIIAELEEYCGEGIYSRALAEAAHGPAPSIDVFSDCVAVNSAVAKLLSDLHQLSADGRLCAKDRAALGSTIGLIEEQVEAVKAALDQPEAVRLVQRSGE